MSGLREVSMSTESFYGKNTPTKNNLFPTTCKTYSEYKKEQVIEKYPFKYLSPESPSCAWKVFNKQKDALQNAKRRANGVMTFVYQSGTNGERHFLVAHPRVFWFYDSKREGQRCSYEIIVEHALCKLYFDLEFCKESNPHHNGVRMTETFIRIVSFFLQEKWSIVCTREHILDLDSSTSKKFSRHLIFQLPGFIFQDNYHVGNFVKTVCSDLKGIKSENRNSSVNFDEIGISAIEFTELFVCNKGKEQLFCDEGVYSKNRHFRLYCSTKWNRKAPLIRSSDNKWLPGYHSNDEMIFLDSLITYIPVGTNYAILQCSNCLSVSVKTSVASCSKVFYPSETESVSPYPDIDRFIRRFIVPGRVYRWCYSSSQNLLNYDIVGNRYCRNIGREHRSNNVRFIVDANKGVFYQKCYDPECKGFSSEPMALPPELMFILEGTISFDKAKGNDSLWESDFREEDLSEVLDYIENCIVSGEMLNTCSS